MEFDGCSRLGPRRWQPFSARSVVKQAQPAWGSRSPACRPRSEDLVMDQTTKKTKWKAATPAPAPELPKFEMPKFEMPKFEMPKFGMPNFDIPSLEIPAAFRELAEKSVSQAKVTYERMKSAAEEATDLLEDTYATASRGAADCGLKMIEAARTNTNAAFDFASEFITVKSLSEAVELSTAHARKQFDAVSAQVQELANLAQKVTTETAEPVKESFSKAFNKVA